MEFIVIKIKQSNCIFVIVRKFMYQIEMYYGV